MTYSEDGGGGGDGGFIRTYADKQTMDNECMLKGYDYGAKGRKGGWMNNNCKEDIMSQLVLSLYLSVPVSVCLLIMMIRMGKKREKNGFGSVG